MSAKSANTLMTMATGIVILVAYVTYAASALKPSGTEDLPWWASTILLFIGIAVVALVAVQVAFRIVLAAWIAARQGGRSDQAERIFAASINEDEMDRLIALSAARLGYVICGIGFLLALILIAVGAAPFLALNLLFFAFALGSLVAGAATILWLEQGIRHR